MSAEYGVFAQIVADAGALVAAAGALAFGFKGRAKWEPADEDIPRGAQKVASLMICIAIALLWYHFHLKKGDESTLVWTLVGLGVATVLALSAYSFIVGLLTFRRVIALPKNKTTEIKIIGGFFLSESAQVHVKQGKTIQNVLAGMQYEPDAVWTRPSRALAKVCFQLAYILLVGCGTSALAAAAILASAKIG